jgi:hypothetical protein
MNLEELEKEVLAIQERNRKVEADKAWETSLERKIVITILTYAVITLLFIAADISNPFINAFVPTAAFLLSTLTLPWFKKRWQSRKSKS